ncbi:Ger(x)C family spore germination protein [Paenibacillus sp. 1001270B_150601_E10]|uniref:Ger(x)C family spore germination protein n=1 Tax=Paenibacillus sp. 1001270B_150601_E10 TaxID=2787079 RepID=UPI0018A10C88|nr:Ger(x)C family spore germination protein [Paenibacillus sp. 1001270B_150601_E10]
MRKSVFFAILLIGVSLICTSCWDRKELREIALCTAMSVEKTKNTYHLSFQLINPGSVVQGQQGGTGGASNVTTYTSTGTTIEEAARKATQQMSRKMLFSHMAIIVIDSSVAKEGIKSLLDIFERDSDMRMQTNVVIARDSPASQLLALSTTMERIPAIQMTQQLIVAEQQWGETHHIQIDEVKRQLASDGKELTIGGMGISGDEDKINKESNDNIIPASTLQTKGIAVFNKDRLVGWLDQESAQGYLWTQKLLRRTAIRLSCEDQNGYLMISISRNKSDLQTIKIRNRYLLRVRVRAAGSVKEIGGCSNEILQNRTLMKLEQQASRKIKNEIETTLKIAQELKLDIFGFGASLDRTDRRLWKRVQKDWNEIFSNADTEVRVDMSIINTGLTVNQTRTK